MASIREAIKKAVGDDAFENEWSPRTQMAVALNATGRHIYANTVSKATIAKRRAVNKRARAARRLSR